MGELMHRCDLPPGVLQIVPAPGPSVGRIMAEHPLVRVLSLTGSTATGRWLMAAAAPQIKRVALELGGNAPFLVLEDANLEEVVEQLVQLKLFVSGQVCVTANRILVDRKVEPRLCKLLQQKLLSRRVGHGLDQGVEAGPLIDRAACQKVQGLVEQAIAEGAEMVCQNRTFEEDPRLQHDRFYPPTLLRHVEDAMPIAQQEIFGPVLPLMAFDRVEEAIERANGTPMGLAAYVYGSRIDRCQAIARELEVGIVGINEWRPLKAEIPFGGVKQSGLGSEGGEEGLHDFLVPRVISLPKPTY
jgi:succinate-semialdehyde dehydrogenase/glutarate-semialdehyde dehydrogenase